MGYFIDIDWVGGPSAVAILFIGLILDWVIGDPKWIPHPVRAIGFFIYRLEKNLNKVTYTDRSRMFNGIIIVILIAGFSFLVGWMISHYTKIIPYGWLLELLLIVLLIAQRDMFVCARQVIIAIRNKDIDDSRRAVSSIVGRQTDNLNESGIARATIESCAENFSDGVVAPVFWYLILGLPGLAAYKAINTLDSMIGYKSTQYISFGSVAARLDDLVNWIPARMAGFFLVLASFFIRNMSPRKSLLIMIQDAGKHPSPNAGWPESAAAGALDLALLGPINYQNGVSKTIWIGTGREAATENDITRMLHLFVIACFLVIVTVVLIELCNHLL